MYTKLTTFRLCSTAFLFLFAVSSLNASSLFGHVKLYKSGVTLESSIAIADVNGDGNPDLLTVGEPYDYAFGEVGVLLGTGKGKFGSFATYYTSGTYPTSIALGDVNGDGHADVVVANYENIAVLFGNGDGTFQAAQTFGSGVKAVALADVNGDGKLDLLVAADNSVEVRFGNGDGTFQAAQNYGTGGYMIAVADVNGDGTLDMLVTTDGVSVFLGNGDGTFEPPQDYASGGNSPQSIFVHDVNGDGKPDLIVANLLSNNVGVLLGNGDGTFQPVETYDSGGFYADAAVAADLNGDGIPDLAVANEYGGVSGKSVVGVLLGNGDGTFQAAQTVSLGVSGSSTIAAADVTGSGMPDLIVSGCRAIRHCVDGMFAVLPNTTTGIVTATALSSDLNPSKHGQAVTFAATVSSPGPTPTGKVKFMDGTTSLGSVALSGGIATVTKSKLAVGTHPITAQYLGDAAHAKSTSPVLNQVVQ